MSQAANLGYLDTDARHFLQGLEQRNPHELEPLQAVAEFVESIMPFIRDHARYQKLALAAIGKFVLPEYLSQVECYSDDARAIVSEPIVDLPDLWCEIPESTFVTIEGGRVECRDFEPVFS